MVLLLLIFGLFASQTWAEEVPPKDCEALVAQYGTLEVANIAHASRHGIITVEVNGQLVEKMGTQDPRFITPRSVCADLEKGGVSLEKLPEFIHQHQQMVKHAAEQEADLERRREAARERGRRQEAEQQQAQDRAPTAPPAKHGESIPVTNAVCEVLSPMAILKSDKVGEFMGLMKSGLKLEAALCCVACSVSSGTKILITDAGWQTHTVRVLEGPSYGCIGDLSGKVIGNCQWP
jgi:hypothetical protein